MRRRRFGAKELNRNLSSLSNFMDASAVLQEEDFVEELWTLYGAYHPWSPRQLLESPKSYILPFIKRYWRCLRAFLYIEVVEGKEYTRCNYMCAK